MKAQPASREASSLAATFDQAIAMIATADRVTVWIYDRHGRPMGFAVTPEDAINALQMGADLPKIELTDDNQVWIG